MELSRDELILMRRVLVDRIASCNAVLADKKANNTARAEATTQLLRAERLLKKTRAELERVNAEIQADIDRS